ncbi:hypothetical protein CsSME_00022387 [Camellia sinensis var. sinensis]
MKERTNFLDINGRKSHVCTETSFYYMEVSQRDNSILSFCFFFNCLSLSLSMFHSSKRILFMEGPSKSYSEYSKLKILLQIATWEICSCFETLSIWNCTVNNGLSHAKCTITSLALVEPNKKFGTSATSPSNHLRITSRVVFLSFSTIIFSFLGVVMRK